MQFDRERIRAIVFDFGNTLVEFAQPQIAACDGAIADALRQRYGPLDLDHFRAIRDRNRMAPYAGDPPEYRENDIREITANLVRELYRTEPAEEDVEEIVRVRFATSVHVFEAPDGVADMLARLRRRYRLGLLSNYPDGAAIRASVKRVGFDAHFNSVVVSGDLGFAKPHPLPFQVMSTNLDVPPHETLFVGDNWVADVQGAKRAGMYMALLLEWIPYERFDRRPNDSEPDLVIHKFSELEDYV